jgi:hypothetical protein
VRHLLSGIAVVITLAIIISIGPVWAQALLPVQPQSPPAPSYGYPLNAPSYSYPLNALTPNDAYKQGLINRWELEQLVGPTPPALQGPSPDGTRGAEPSGN